MRIIENAKSLLFGGRLWAAKAFHAAFCATVARESCVCCGKRTFLMPVCGPCQKKYLLGFEPPGKGRCRLCGKILLSQRDSCSSCRGQKTLLHADAVFPLWQYRLWMKDLLFEWKMGGNRSLSPLFASCVHTALCLLYPGRKKESIPLVPVPPRPGKIREKGWDQIEELCSILHYRYGWTVLRLLKRISSQQQKTQDREHRFLLGSSSYLADGRAARRLFAGGNVPSEVVLLDDVMTTGATVDSCAAVLKGQGIRKVQVITLLIVD